MLSSSWSRAPYRARVLPLLFAAMIAVTGLVTPLAPASADTTPDGSKELLYHKHVDAAHAGWDGDHLDLFVIDGETRRPADEVAIRLAPDANDDGQEVSRRIVDEHHKFIAPVGSVVWHAPQELDWSWRPVWPGLGAGDMPKDKVDPASVYLELTGAGGPGDVEVYRDEPDDTVERALSSKDPEHRTYQRRPGEHGHFAWAFTKPGVYNTTWKVHAKSPEGKELVSPERTVTWLVGTDEQVGLPRGTYPHVNMTDPVAPLPEGWNGDDTTTPEDPAPADPKPEQPAPEQPAPTPAEGECTPINSGHLDMSPSVGDNGLATATLLWDTMDGQHIAVPSEKFSLLVPDHSLTEIPTNGTSDELRAFMGKDSVYQLPETQDETLPWPGFSTEKLDYSELEQVDITMEDVEGPKNGRIAVTHYDSRVRKNVVDLTGKVGSTESSGKAIGLKNPAHTHRGFSFSEPGEYTVNFFFHLKGKNGGTRRAKMTTTFAVGDDASTAACGGTGEIISPEPEQPADPEPTDPEPAPEQPAPEQPAPEQPDSGRLVIEKGHVDAFNVSQKDGKLLLDLKEDVTGQHVHHKPADVELHVKDAAKTTIPEGYPGAGAAWYLPQEQDANLIWPGWDTLEAQGNGIGKSIDLQFTDVRGPGKVFLFGTDGFGGPKALLENDATELTSGAIRRQSFPAHTHANWAFTEPGIYTITVRAAGTKDGKAVASNTATYTFTVGDSFKGKADAGANKPDPSQPAPSDPKPADPKPEDPAPSNPAPEKPAPEKPSTGDDKGTTPAAERLVIDQGHVDAFNVGAKNGKLTLDLKEDVTGQHVHHKPADVELHVKDAAKTTIPAGYPGAGEAWYLPQVQDEKLLWPGWDTLETQGGGVGGSIDLQFTDVKGPGKVFLFGTGGLGKPEPVLQNGATQLTSGAVRRQAYPAHTHANWAFTKPGVYEITVRATGTAGGKAVTSNTETYLFTVGDKFRGTGTTGSTGSGDGNGSADADGSTGAGNGSDNGSDGTGSTGSDSSDAGDVTLGGASGGTREPVCHSVEETREATADEVAAALGGGNAPKGGGKSASASTGGAHKVSGSYTIPKSTHIHPNWVFSAPGTYKVTVRQSVKTTSGQTLSDTATLTFNVGPGASGVTNGHFDFGARLEGGKLVPSIKDDRSAPAKWVSPSSLTFAISDEGKAKAPAGIEFVAPAGHDVWMIGSTQVNGVPWVGANSMHDSIVSGTTGEITLQLTSVSGPGNVGVFSSGNFGQVVGQKWFSATKGTEKAAPKADEKSTAGDKPAADADLSKITLTKDKAQVGQVFVEDGKAMIKEVVGRTDSGEACDVNGAAGGKMARTGTNATGFGLIAMGLIGLGGGIALLRRRLA